MDGPAAPSTLMTYSMPAGHADVGHLVGLLAALPHATAIFDSSLVCLHCNRAFAALSGQEPAAWIGRAMWARLPALSAKLETPMRRCLDEGHALVDQAIDILAADGASQHWLISLAPSGERNSAGGAQAHANANAVIVQLRPLPDNTDQAIRAAETHARRVLDNLFTFVGLLTPDGTIVDANRAPLEAGGQTLEQVRGTKIWDSYWFAHDPYLQARIELAVEAARRGDVSRFDIVVRMKNDSRMALDFMLAPLHNDDGEIIYLVPSANDISDRTSSEEALRQSEERFRCVVEAAPDGLAMVDRNGCLALVNSGMERIFGYPREELLGQPIEMLMPERYRSSHPGLRGAYMRAPTTRDMAGRRELYARRKDGSEFPVEIGLNALNIVGGEHVLAAIVDVTKRKADQAVLKKALDEKTVLLNEVHHRVKNNLQVVCSLLSLQARSASDDARAMLEESQARIKAMALIHQLLYERSDFSTVDLGVYLRRLGSLLREMLGQSRIRVSLQIEADDDITMDLQRSVPCGLLINELVTNAIKHAFPDGRSGQIMMHAELLEPTLARIVVSDNGIGVPVGMEPGHVSASLGFQLVPLFVDQLGGELRLIRDHGSRFELYFKPGMEAE